MIISALHAIFT